MTVFDANNAILAGITERYPRLAVNTSNPGKLQEFQRFLGNNVSATNVDLKEPDSDPITVIRYKASQDFNTADPVLVDDTILEVENETVGVNVKWLLETLPQHYGKKAWFVCMLGLRVGDVVNIYRGQVEGILVCRRGTSPGLGFLPYFLPVGCNQTLAEHKPDQFNARYLALKAIALDSPFIVAPVLPLWDGAWQ